MTDRAREIAYKIFDIIAAAEAEAHALPVEEVHFHEVGALDSIADVMAAAVTFDSLGVSEVIVPKLCEGTGMVRCAHGMLPVPVPATLNICRAAGMPLEIMDAPGEYVTPTGAAIAAAISTSHTLPKRFRVVKTGLGAGKREYPGRANLLRAMLIEEETGEDIVKLETDIDDATGEQLGYAMEKLFAAGARDVHYAPVFMKKNRPAWELTVICDGDKKEALEEIIFAETTTIGIREIPCTRAVLAREERTVETKYGPAEVKFVTLAGQSKGYPEYESARKIAAENHISLAEAMDVIREAMRN